MIRLLTILIALCPVLLMAEAPVESDSNVELLQLEDRVSVRIDGEIFTEYIFEGYEKPILYPVIGPFGSRMTRDFPMTKASKGEAEDHPHHKSIWFGHMKVNDESFWHVGPTAGKTVQDYLLVVGNRIIAENRLVARDGKLVAKDSREIGFGQINDVRFIDYSVTYHATESDIVFGDNKDGQMGIRMHPKLRIEGPVANGQAINAEGVREQNIWGKRSPWIDYWGVIDEKTVGIAMFDHPSNLRHPTWWHARDYGLLSANPFGVHHFEEKDDPHLGDYTLKQGDSLTFRHRFLFHPGDYSEANVAELYKQWSQQ